MTELEAKHILDALHEFHDTTVEALSELERKLYAEVSDHDEDFDASIGGSR